MDYLYFFKSIKDIQYGFWTSFLKLLYPLHPLVKLFMIPPFLYKIRNFWCIGVLYCIWCINGDIVHIILKFILVSVGLLL